MDARWFNRPPQPGEYNPYQKPAKGDSCTTVCHKKFILAIYRGIYTSVGIGLGMGAIGLESVVATTTVDTAGAASTLYTAFDLGACLDRCDKACEK